MGSGSVVHRYVSSPTSRAHVLRSVVGGGILFQCVFEKQDWLESKGKVLAEA